MAKGLLAQNWEHAGVADARILLMAAGVPFFGKKVWHHSWVLVAFFVVFSLGLAASALTDGEIPLMERLCWSVPWPVLVWLLVVRPRIVVSDDEITVVRWFRTVRHPLLQVVGARPRPDGTVFTLDDGRTFNAGTLQRPNYAAWLVRRREQTVSLRGLSSGPLSFAENRNRRRSEASEAEVSPTLPASVQRSASHSLRSSIATRGSDHDDYLVRTSFSSSLTRWASAHLRYRAGASADANRLIDEHSAPLDHPNPSVDDLHTAIAKPAVEAPGGK